MTSLEIWLLAVGLAMDCFAVSVASGIILKQIQWRPMLVMALFFGVFQAVMPLIGWTCTNAFSHLIESYDHWIAFALLAFLGGKMIWESFKSEEECHLFNPTRLKVVLTLAVATSIDALAVGISFSCLGMKTIQSILSPVLVIGLVSFLFSMAGLLIGIFFRKRFYWPAEPAPKTLPNIKFLGFVEVMSNSMARVLFSVATLVATNCP